MKPLILAIATAMAPYQADQTNIAKKISQLCHLNDKDSQFIEKLYDKTQIKKRCCVLKDFVNDDLQQNEFLNNDFLQNIPGSKKRNDIYMQYAPLLAQQAAQNALSQSGIASNKITHIISVSCTGLMAPGIEYILQKELNIPSTAQRIGINFMGCFGAFRALAVASAIAKENTQHRILVVCTELCSLHFQVSAYSDVLVGNALFADGAGAMIIGCIQQENEKALMSIEKCGSHAIENTLDKMTWQITDHGFLMRLSKDIPNIINQNCSNVIKDFIKTDFAQLTWAIHPGGKAIIQALENCCNLNRQQTQSAWNILENFGNMSSATFIYVLEDILKTAQQYKDVIGIGFGPGLSIEMISLKLLN